MAIALRRPKPKLGCTSSFSERRLAAILATDVVGFSKLVSQSEVSTLAALQELRTRLIDPLVASRSGRLFKLVGDGALYEFPSVVQAVEAAVAFQDAMAAEAGAIRFRIGIHLGDVIPDGDDLLGDGVNIAVRIEAAAPTGGVALSDDAHRQVRDRLLLNWSDGGEQSLKNISRAMRVWYWSPDEAPLPENSVLSVAEAVKPSIAVLPFDNLSGDAEQEFFSDGLVEDITAALSRYSTLRVASRSSAFSFRSAPTDLRSIARALRVRYILKGGVRRAGQRLRVTAQLIDAEPDAHVWADRYDRDLTDLFAIQDEITQSIVSAVGSEVEAAETRRVERRDITTLDAWERYMKALWHTHQQDAVNNALSQKILQAEIDAGSSSAQVWSLMAWALSFDLIWGLSGRSPVELVNKAIDSGRTAVALDPGNENAHACLSLALWLTGDHDKAISEARAAIRLNPNFLMGNATLGYALAYSGPDHLAAAEAALEKAEQLGPRDYLLRWIYVHRAVACFTAGEYARARELAERALEEDPHLGTALRTIAAAFAFEDRPEDARAAWQRAKAAHDIDLSALRFALDRMFKRRTDAEKFARGLALAGAPIAIEVSSTK